VASNVETTFRFLVGKGLSPAQAAGVVGGLSGESGAGLSTTAKNPSSGAFGIGQWLGGRKSALLARKNPHSLSTQLNFLWDELQGPESAAFKQVKGARTIEDATKAWVLGFERPAANETTLGPRTQTARNVFNTYKGAGGASLPAQDGAAPAQGSSVSQVQPNSTAGVDLLSSLLQQSQPQAPQASPLQAPAFSAGPALPTGYQPASSSAGPTAPQASVVDSLLPLVSQIQGQEPAPAATPAPGASADVASPNTGPGSEGTFGKSHSPLFELIHKGDKPYAVKNGKVVDPSIYAKVWDNHAGHVHVAAGPNTIVALGKLAQSMGLTVGSNIYFTGHPETSGHVSDSYHYRTGKTKSGKVAGEAIDVSGDPHKQNLFAARVQSLYGLG
jgi:hypothetical protein